MKYSTTILITSILLLTSSCKSIMMKMNGVKTPDFVTEQQVTKFLKKNGVPENANLFVCRDSASLLSLLFKVGSIPETNFFNSKGELLVYGDSVCPGLASKFASSLSQTNAKRVDPSYRFEDIMAFVKPLTDNKLIHVADYDYTVIFYWATFTGNINNNVFTIEKDLKNNTHISCQILYVDLDFLKSWGMKNIPSFNLN
jgi:hypothetical protein